jgi:hypothetical protein
MQESLSYDSLVQAIQRAAQPTGAPVLGFMDLDTWRSLVTIVAFFLPFILGGIVFWLSKFFVRRQEWEARHSTTVDEQKKDINGLGTRVAEIATSTQTSLGKLEILNQQMERSQADRENIHRDLGKLETLVNTLTETIQRNEVTRLTELGDIRERMIRVETKLDVDIAARRQTQSEGD